MGFKRALYIINFIFRLVCVFLCSNELSVSKRLFNCKLFDFMCGGMLVDGLKEVLDILLFGKLEFEFRRDKHLDMESFLE